MGCCDQPGLMPLSEGLEALLAGVTPVTETERVSLSEAQDRVLAEDVLAQAPVPGFNNSAMDGYAIHLDSVDVGQSIPVQGKSFAGAPFMGTLLPGHAIRIMTGAIVPEGADCVIMQENAESDGETVRFTQLAERGNNIRRAGEDIAEGQIVLPRETLINAPRLALLASVGCDQITVYRRTRVGLISTGDELKTPGEPLSTGQLYNSNGPALKAMLKKLNVELIDFGIVPDDLEQLRDTFKKADLTCDFVMTSGGVSVGEADYTKDILEEMGQINFWKLAIKPGKPFAFGRLPNSLFMGLPGNPVSAIVTFHILGAQAVRQHQRVGFKPMKVMRAIAAETIAKSPGRMDFQRGNWVLTDRGVEARLTRKEQGSHILSSLADADCYIALEAERGSVHAGEEITLWLFDELVK